MRHTRCGILLIYLLLPLSAGCRLPGREGPVPQSLADCRRLSQRGVAALEKGRQQTAETMLAQAVTACPVDAQARRYYAEALWRRGAGAEAIAQMEEAVRLAEEDASLWVRLAEMYLAGAQAELARQCAERAIDLDPKLPAAWAIRGGAMRSFGRPREALTDYLRALGRAPNDRDILLAVAELYVQLDQQRRALQTLQGLAETYSPGEEPGRVLYLMGAAYVAEGRLDDGVKCLEAAVTRDKPTPEMYCRLGEAQLTAGRPAEAEVAARQALAMQPQFQPARELMQRIEVARQGRDTIQR